MDIFAIYTLECVSTFDYVIPLIGCLVVSLIALALFAACTPASILAVLQLTRT